MCAQGAWHAMRLLTWQKLPIKSPKALFTERLVNTCGEWAREHTACNGPQ